MNVVRVSGAFFVRDVEEDQEEERKRSQEVNNEDLLHVFTEQELGDLRLEDIQTVAPPSSAQSNTQPPFGT